MTEQDKKGAIRYIEAQLESGYIDLGAHDEDEIEIVREAMAMWKAIDTWNSIGCTSFIKASLSDEDIEAALKQLKESESVVVNVRDKIHQDILSGKGLPKL